MNYELKEYSMGELIGKTFNIYFSKFFILVFLSLVLYAPVVFFAHNLDYSAYTSGNYHQAFLSFGIRLMPTWSLLFLEIILSIITILIISNHIIKNKMSVSQIITRSLSRFFPVIGVSLLSGLIIIGGFILFVIPGIIFALAVSLAGVITVVEEKPATESISRSWKLTHGSKAAIFGTFILLALIIGIISVALKSALMFLFLGSFHSVVQDIMQKNFGFLNNWIYLLIAYGINVIVAPLYSILLVLIYFNERVKKEGFDIEHLADEISNPDKHVIENGPKNEA